MIITEEEVKLVLEKALEETYNTELYPEGWKELDGILMSPESIDRMKEYFKDCELTTEDTINETTFEIDPKDPNMQQKIQKIEGDSTLFTQGEDDIQIKDKTQTESTYKKSDVLHMMAEAKIKKASVNDALNAVKKADREIEYQEKGPGWTAKDKAHKNKKKYDRKNLEAVNENVLLKQDVINLILEKKHNGKIYKKSELLEIINKQELD